MYSAQSSVSITVKDLRKISSTSDFSKLFERFLKKEILEGTSAKLDPAQYWNQKGTGTDHILCALVDRILEDTSTKLDPAQYWNQKGTVTDHILVARVDRILEDTSTKLDPAQY